MTRLPDYFTLLGLPVAFALDEAALHRAYIEGQQRCHPDRAAKAAEGERLAAVQRSVEINNAYHTLKSPLLRAEYLLSLEHVLVGSEEGAVKASPELLMESMEMREALMEAEDGPALRVLAQEADAAHQESLTQFAVHYDENKLELAAQDTIRLRFLEKFLEELRMKAQGFYSHSN